MLGGQPRRSMELRITSSTLRWRCVSAPPSPRSGISWMSAFLGRAMSTPSVSALRVVMRPCTGSRRTTGCFRRSAGLSVVLGRLTGMRTAYESRTHNSNISSRRVLNGSNIRATTRTDVLSNTGSTVALAAGMEESMSALEWSPTDVGYAGSAAPRRPHLVVLPGGAGRPAQADPVRVTRRGRLALLGLAVAIGAVVGLMGMGGAGAAEQLPTVTVAPGQTLSELPEMSISEGVLAIQMANKMSTAQVSAGQRLVIPRS